METDAIKKHAMDTGYRTIVAVMPSRIDEFVKWLMTGTGATAALLVTSADKLLPVFGVSGLRATVYLLVASVALGMVSRFLASIVTAVYALLEQMEVGLTNDPENPLKMSFMDDNTDPAMEKQIQDEFLEPLPVHVRILSRWLSTKRKKPSRLSLLGRVLVKSSAWQGVTASLSLLLAILGMVCAVVTMDLAAPFPAPHP